VYLVAWDVESALHESSVLTWLQAQPVAVPPSRTALHCIRLNRAALSGGQGGAESLRRYIRARVRACMRRAVCARKWERERVRALVCACVPSRAALRAFLPRARRGAKGARVSATDAHGHALARTMAAPD
jgi:hypothetical protein